MFLFLFSFLISFIKCGQFVPLVPEETMMLFKLNTTELAKLIEEAPRVVVLLHDPSNSQSYKAREALADSINLFRDYLIFAQINSNEGESIINLLNISAPHILFYLNGSLWTHCNFPASETALLFMLNLFAEGERNPITTETQFLKSLGTSYFSLLYPQEERNESSHAHRFATALAGFIDLIPFTKKFADSFGLNYSQMYLFRLEDVSLIPVSDNVTEILAATHPDFKRINPEDFSSDLGLVLGAVVNKVTPNTVNFLESVSEVKNDNITIGFIDRPLHQIANITNGGSIQRIPSIVLFSNIKREYYSIPDEINQNFYEGKTLEAAEKIKKYLNNLPKPLEPSEEIPTSQTGDIIKIVGKTHDSFALDPSKDSLIMYVSVNNIQTQKFYRVFQEVANEYLSSPENDKIQFGVINATLNSATFPSMAVLPHIEIYPSRNKTDHMTFYGQSTRDEYVRFINENGSFDYSVKAPEATKNDLSLEIVQIYACIRTIDDEARRKANNRLMEIAPKVGISLDDLNSAVFVSSDSTETNTTSQ